jgi:hypothetical protein
MRKALTAEKIRRYASATLGKSRPEQVSDDAKQSSFLRKLAFKQEQDEKTISTS